MLLGRNDFAYQTAAASNNMNDVKEDFTANKTYSEMIAGMLLCIHSSLDAAQMFIGHEISEARRPKLTFGKCVFERRRTEGPMSYLLT